LKNRKLNIKGFILNLAIVKTILKWSKNYSFPGFSGVPIYDVLYFVIQEIKKDNLTTRANSVAFSFFLSLFPTLIFLLPIFSHTPLADNYIILLRESLAGVIPSNAEAYLFGIIDSIKLEGQIGWLSAGFFLALIFSSSGMLTLMSGFDKSYDITFKSRNYFQKRLVAINLIILLSVLLIVSISLIILGKQFLGYLSTELNLGNLAGIGFSVLRWMIVIMLFYAVITIIYRYGPSMFKPLKWINPGASLATLFSILSSVGFSYFVNNFGRYNEIYGSIGALIVILLWFQINAFILLAGFELNASIAVNRDLKIYEEG
jgi:membrane protein